MTAPRPKGTGDNFMPTDDPSNDWRKSAPYFYQGGGSDRGVGVGTRISEKLAQRVLRARNHYYAMLRARYRELITNIRKIENAPISVNNYVIEYYLRHGYEVALGKARNGKMMMLGYVNNTYTATNPQVTFAREPLQWANITFILPDELIPKKRGYHEISQFDNAETGDFVILRNKDNCFTSDYQMIDYYCDRLAEIMSSRYSLIMQAKLTSVIPVQDGNSETADQIVAMMENGQPYIEVNDAYGFKDLVSTIGDSSVPDRLKVLKEAYNDEIAELDNYLGINTTGIDKASGVNAAEVQSNDPSVMVTQNLYRRGVQEGLDLLNKRFGLNYQVSMVEPVVPNDPEGNDKQPDQPNNKQDEQDNDKAGVDNEVDHPTH